MNGLGLVVLELVAVALVLALLNARDRRRARAIAAVLGGCPTASRGSIALRTRGSFLSRRVALVLDLSECDDGDVWPVVRRLAGARPSRVTLVLVARLGATQPVFLRIPGRGRGYPARLTAPAGGVSGSR